MDFVEARLGIHVARTIGVRWRAVTDPATAPPAEMEPDTIGADTMGGEASEI